MWRVKNRPRYNRDHLRYPSDLTDEEWALVAPLIPPGKPGGGKRRVNLRDVVHVTNRMAANAAAHAHVQQLHDQDEDEALALLLMHEGS